MLHRFALATAAWMALAGCVSNSYCLEEYTYQSAESAPPLVGAENLDLPRSATALRIPPPPENPVPFGVLEVDEDGDERGRCLDLPPRMPGLSTAKAEPASEPAPEPSRKETPDLTD